MRLARPEDRRSWGLRSGEELCLAPLRRFGLLLAGLCVWQVVGALPRLSAQVDAQIAEASGPRSAEDEAFERTVQIAVDAYHKADYAAARAYFAQAHGLRPSARTWRGLGATAFELKQFDDAVRELTLALEDQRSPLTPALRVDTELTLRLARRGQLERAGKPARAELGSVESGSADLALPPGHERAAPQPGPDIASEASHQPARDSGLSPQGVAALAWAGAGMVGVALGLGFGVRSMAKASERDRLCPDPRAGCSSAAVRAADAALSAGDISTVACLIGGAALAAGVVLWWTDAGSERTKTARAAPGSALAVGLGSVQASASF